MADFTPIPDKIFFTKTAKKLQSDLVQSFKDKDMYVTGNTAMSIRYEITSKGFRVLGASYIEVNERGRPPANDSSRYDPSFLEKLKVWAAARGITIPAEAIRKAINKKGTLLWQGKDPRFTGNKSEVITDIVNKEFIEKLKDSYFKNKLTLYFTDLQSIILK